MTTVEKQILINQVCSLKATLSTQLPKELANELKIQLRNTNRLLTLKQEKLYSQNELLRYGLFVHNNSQMYVDTISALQTGLVLNDFKNQ